MPPREADAPKKTMSAPLAASTASRKKLKAFEFAGDTGATVSLNLETDKENSLESKSRQRELINEHSPKRPSKCPSPNTKTTEEKDSKAVLGYPQTPVGRVPLQELINNDGNLLDTLPNVSPIERIVWNGSPQTSSQVASILTPALRRGKRKRQPSEPVSSQLQASNHFVMEGGKAPPEVNTQALLKTPQADPVKELWMRYSVDGPERTPITSAAIARFLNSSSPRSHDSDRGLQRSLTCASGWPTSTSKRGRIDMTFTQINFNYSKDFRDVLQDKEEAARCREKLIQKINQSFTIPPALSRNDDTSGSSPTVSNEDPNHHLQDSPLDRLNTGVGGPSSPIRIDSPPLDDRFVQSFSQTEVSVLHPESDRVNHEITTANESISGPRTELRESDELDKDTLKAKTTFPRNNPPTEAGQLKSLNRNAPSRQKECQDARRADDTTKLRYSNATSNQRDNDLHSLPPREVTKAVVRLPCAEEEYDFGDDDDFLDAELEAVIASYDVRPPTTHEGRPPGTGGETGQLPTADPSCLSRVAQGENHEPGSEVVDRVTHEISSDDEFGADSDFEELANVFAQAAEQVRGVSSDAVRTVHYGNSR